MPGPAEELPRLADLVAGRQKTTNLSFPGNDNFYDEK